MKKYIKILFAIVFVLFLGTVCRTVNAVEVEIDDVKWTWGTIENNLKVYGGVKAAFAKWCQSNPTISEYLKRCNVTAEEFAKQKVDLVYEMLKPQIEIEEGREVLTLRKLLNAITAKDIKNHLLVLTLIYDYESFAGAGTENSSEMKSKKMYEELLRELDIDDKRKEELRKSFAQVYYVQQLYNSSDIQEIIKNWMEETDDPQQKQNGGFLIKDAAVYKLIHEKGVNISKATPYDKLADTVEINTAEEYVTSYTYLFALATLTKEEVNQYIDNYVELIESKEESNYYWEWAYYKKAMLYSNSDGDWYYVNIGSKWRLPMTIDSTGIKDLDSITGNEVITVDNHTEISDVTNNIIDNIVAGRLHFASMFYRKGQFSSTEYSIGTDGMLYDSYGHSLLGMSGLMQDIIDYNPNTMYRFSNGKKNFYFCENSGRKDYLLTLPKKDFNNDGVEDSALGWFKILTNDFKGKNGVVGLLGEYDAKTKTFIYDQTAEYGGEDSVYVYYIKIHENGGSAVLYDTDIELYEEDGTEYVHTYETEELEVKTVKIRQNTKYVNIFFDSYNDLHNRVSSLLTKMGSVDLYKKLQSNTDVKTAKNNIDEVLEQLNKYISYKNLTIEQMKLKNKELTADEGIDYSSLKYCPDEVDVSGICKDDWWGCAFGFLQTGKDNGTDISDQNMLSELETLIFDIGNIIFIVITAFLGVKYIWGGVDSKYSVKNSLVTLVVAAIVFYGWNAVTNIFNVQELLTGSTSEAGYQNFATIIYNTIMYIVNVAAIGGIIYIGIKYMMAGADGKAEMKLKLIPVIMGIIMVYGTLNLINFILDIVYSI